MEAIMTPAAGLFPDPPNDPAGWTGWRRPKGGRWLAVSRGESEAEAFRKLLDVAARNGAGSFDSIVLPVGEEP